MSEATLPTETEREAEIQEMLRDAKITELEVGDRVVHRGDSEQPAPMIVNKVTSAGYVYLWDTRTFRKTPVLYYMAAKKLRVRREDGSYRFTLIDPKREPVHGNLLCKLHPDAPDHEHYKELGFRECKKSNITNPYQLQRHMQLKHKQEWAAIKAEEEERKRQEDRELQRALVESSLRNNDRPLYISDKDKRKQQEVKNG